MLQPKEELRMNNIKEKEQCNTTSDKDIKCEKLQEGTLIWEYLDLISKVFTVNNTGRHESNAELRTILFKEGGNDPNMGSPQAKISQAKKNQGGYMADQPIDWMFTNLPADLAEHTDLDATIEEGQSQARPNMSIQAWQSKEESMRNVTATLKQYKDMHSGQQTTEQPSDDQPTLRTIERLVWCTYQHGNSRDGIFGHGRKSQDSELARRVLTEPTRLAPRSCVRLIFDNG
ncbi:uncharacterized protein LOC130823730 [Amaranthus tricolor]|uniref:uncharacterized protein LOC130823730 n=1 Tax=Amaranthus tricolor TaxID=29722 RepID=UPI0025874CA1|nr:uncharacterized protein LOC130823730 [Amaranthus tricolor]XP_057544450.1 uncharacterized protein LOC130823730 [Amaranthus tricolor]